MTQYQVITDLPQVIADLGTENFQIISQFLNLRQQEGQDSVWLCAIDVEEAQEQLTVQQAITLIAFIYALDKAGLHLSQQAGRSAFCTINDQLALNDISCLEPGRQPTAMQVQIYRSFAPPTTKVRGCDYCGLMRSIFSLRHPAVAALAPLDEVMISRAKRLIVVDPAADVLDVQPGFVQPYYIKAENVRTPNTSVAKSTSNCDFAPLADVDAQIDLIRVHVNQPAQPDRITQMTKTELLTLADGVEQARQAEGLDYFAITDEIAPLLNWVEGLKIRSCSIENTVLTNQITIISEQNKHLMEQSRTVDQLKTEIQIRQEYLFAVQQKEKQCQDELLVLQKRNGESKCKLVGSIRSGLISAKLRIQQQQLLALKAYKAEFVINELLTGTKSHFVVPQTTINVDNTVKIVKNISRLRQQKYDIIERLHKKQKAKASQLSHERIELNEQICQLQKLALVRAQFTSEPVLPRLDIKSHSMVTAVLKLVLKGQVDTTQQNHLHVQPGQNPLPLLLKVQSEFVPIVDSNLEGPTWGLEQLRQKQNPLSGDNYYEVSIQELLYIIAYRAGVPENVLDEVHMFFTKPGRMIKVSHNVKVEFQCLAELAVQNDEKRSQIMRARQERKFLAKQLTLQGRMQLAIERGDVKE